MALRVIGGTLGSRRLGVPPVGVRPTSDRVREALFSRLEPVAGLRVLDLFAGTGALGIEALSRGADAAVFVDASNASLASVRANLTRLDLDERSRVLRGDAVRCVRRLGRDGARFDLVFLDPPYAAGEVAPALAALLEAGVLAAGATVVVETAKRLAPEPVAGLSLLDQRRYGDTLITRLVAGRLGSASSGGESRDEGGHENRLAGPADAVVSDVE